MGDNSVFSVRIVTVDYYMSAPLPIMDSCQGAKVHEVPVIRIFGSTPAGQKTCLHIHGALPYLYVPCADIPIEVHRECDYDAYLRVVSVALEEALKFKSNAFSEKHHIHSCCIVRAKRFYGYHPTEELFVKICLYHPRDISRAAGLLLGGSVFNKTIQPHEAHMPYILQFMVDYNLYGMGHIHLLKLKFRSPLPDHCLQQTDNSSAMMIWSSTSVPDALKWDCSVAVDSLLEQNAQLVPRQTRCELEADTGVDDILNQQFRSYHSLSQTQDDVRMVQSLIPIWEEEFERSGLHDEETTMIPNVKPLPQVVLAKLSHGHGRNTHNNNSNNCDPEEMSTSVREMDGDALALLRWLASSQAAEEIDSDDELVRDPALTPLVPSSSIDQVLEKANRDYETESQQECSDILDSLNDDVSKDTARDTKAAEAEEERHPGTTSSIAGGSTASYLVSCSSQKFVREKREAGSDLTEAAPHTCRKLNGEVLYMMTPSLQSPTRSTVQQWLLRESSGKKPNTIAAEKQSQPSQDHHPCHISAPPVEAGLTPVSQKGFRDSASVGAGQQLTLLSVEIQTACREGFRPDPQFDAVDLVAMVVQDDHGSSASTHLLLCSSSDRGDGLVMDCVTVVSADENDLFRSFIDIVRAVDADILMGWDIQGASIGYMAERASLLGIDLLDSIARTLGRDPTAITTGHHHHEPSSSPSELVGSQDSLIEDEWGRTHASGIHVCGRIVLNVWRLIRSEVKLSMYSVDAVAQAVLQRKVPSIPPIDLANWYSSGPDRARFRSIEHAVNRAKLNLEIINQLDMINRTSELARIFGIEFFAVLSRGSQYRVESMMLRLAHTQNYLAVSPGRQQVASQPAMECLPLVMEPESGFYEDPVVVLDFQSLYPSMIIAYNLCFSTCLGRRLSSSPRLGVLGLYSPPELPAPPLVAPSDVAFVPPDTRKGVLPRLLEEILSTRILVKRSMKKLSPSQKILHRIFNSRQLALKLISNVTYGYTAAGFSGRMPCAELADSIVECGRRTLESAVSLVHSHGHWNARVVYGDTDSMFVLLRNRTVSQAFRVGQDIADAVTRANPAPVSLRMEKVYSPCVLLAKKRYVGYSYAGPDQRDPAFDAKGIETVRRDSCGAVAKMMERSLRILFDRRDVPGVRAYVQRQWLKIFSGAVSLQDFVFAKEVRLGTYSRRPSASLPPAAIVALKAARRDPRAEPRYAERVPYVVVHGSPGARLVDLVVDPMDLLAPGSPLRLNDAYYVKKQIIPALQRVLGLLDVDVGRWFSEMPRPSRELLARRNNSGDPRTRIDHYYESMHCLVCGKVVQGSVCEGCRRNRISVVAAIVGRASRSEKEMRHLIAVCRHCGGGDWIVESGVKCTSLACGVFFERRKVQKELGQLSSVAASAAFYPECTVEWF